MADRYWVGGSGTWTGFDPEFLYYRIGAKTGNYTSGAVDVRLGVPFPTSIRLNP